MFGISLDRLIHFLQFSVMLPLVCNFLHVTYIDLPLMSLKETFFRMGIYFKWVRVFQLGTYQFQMGTYQFQMAIYFK